MFVRKIQINKEKNAGITNVSFGRDEIEVEFSTYILTEKYISSVTANEDADRIDNNSDGKSNDKDNSVTTGIQEAESLKLIVTQAEESKLQDEMNKLMKEKGVDGRGESSLEHFFYSYLACLNNTRMPMNDELFILCYVFARKQAEGSKQNMEYFNYFKQVKSSRHRRS